MIKIKLDMKIINGFYTKRIPCIGEYYTTPYGRIFNGKTGRPVATNLVGTQGEQYLGFNVRAPGARTITKVHRAVFQAWNGPIPAGMVVDHENRDKLDNKLSNLRLATRSENCQNNNAKGYSWHHKSKRWKASIMIAGKQKQEYFKLEEDAIKWRAEQVAIHYPFKTI